MGARDSMTSVFIAPRARNNPMGGIARVVEAQQKHLPSYGIDVVDEPSEADVFALHAVAWVPPSPQQRVVSHCHGLYWNEYVWQRWSHAVNAEVIDAMRKADAVTAPSEWVARVIRRGLQAPVRVIGHGIDADEWPLQQSGGLYVLWDKTRVDPICDPRAVNILAASMPSVKFVSSFGDMAPNVNIIGKLPYEEHKGVVQRASLYLATTRETFGIGTLEAMASGVPVVGWDWAGQADIVEHKKTGYLATLNDYDDLKRGIEWCLEHRPDLALNAHRAVLERYQWNLVVKQYADLYKQLAEPHAGPKVSVIMPSHNLQLYLREAIESVIGQDYDDYELIVVDDCSTDGSYLVAKGYESNPHVRVIKTPSNLYLAGALNYGIAASKGEYVLALDADNMLPPGTLKLLAGQLDVSRDLDIVYGKVKFVTEDGEPDTRVAGDGISSWPPKAFNLDMQLNGKNQIPSTAMYRRKVWDRIGGYRRRFKTAEDADFWSRATSFGAKPARITDAITLVYRNRGDSMSRTNETPSWGAWYRWSKDADATPMAAMAPDRPPIVPTYEPITVSVIIPVGPGHGDQGITDALDSLYSQTMNNWECIVVDDTNDGDGGIRWLPSWARVYSTGGAGLGTSIARNLGIKQARGRYLLFLDADDYLEPTALEQMYQAITEHGGYVYSDYWKDGVAVSIVDHKPEDMVHMLYHPITCLLPIEVRLTCKFDESMRVGEDWDYICQVIKGGWCGVHVTEPLLYYRTNSGSNREGLKAGIAEVRSIIEGRYQGMACGCSRGGGQKYSSGSVAGMKLGVTGGSDLVLVEFTRPNAPARTYVGPVTGESYRFGSDDGHSKRYVHRADAEQLLSRPEFAIATN